MWRVESYCHYSLATVDIWTSSQSSQSQSLKPGTLNTEFQFVEKWDCLLSHGIASDYMYIHFISQQQQVSSHLTSIIWQGHIPKIPRYIWISLLKSGLIWGWILQYNWVVNFIFSCCMSKLCLFVTFPDPSIWYCSTVMLPAE